MALELAASDATTDCVAPRFTRTDTLASVPERGRTGIRVEIPGGRFAETEDIAGVVRFLAGPETDYVTGEVIDVTVGWTSEREVHGIFYRVRRRVRYARW